ncbi:MAG: hypothetical protein KC457_29245, partial [Myxococcales bacterium]|nr:hypothetical protein [Myxococcales bacterium]
LGDLLRRKIRERSSEAEDNQRALAIARNDITGLVRRLDQLRETLRSAGAEATRHEDQLDTLRATAENAIAEAEQLGALASACLAAREHGSSTFLRGLADQIESDTAAADRSSSEACDYDEPTDRTEAESLLDRVRREWERTRHAANRAEGALARLADSIANEPPHSDASTSARADLEGALDRLEAMTCFAEAKVAGSRLDVLRARASSQAQTAHRWLEEIEEAAAPWRGTTDLDALADSARAIVGTGRHAETTGTIDQLVARIDAAAARGDQQVTWIELAAPSFERFVQQGWQALGRCAKNEPDEARLSNLLASIPNRLESDIAAASLCLARAQQLAEALEDPASGWAAGELEPTPAAPTHPQTAWGSGELIAPCETPAPARAGIEAALGALQAMLGEPDRYGDLLAAVDALAAAAAVDAVCTDDRARVRTALASVRAAQQQDLETARRATDAAIRQGQARRASNAAAWRTAATALTGVLQGLQRASSGSVPAGSPMVPGASGSGSAAATGGPQASGAACAQIQQSLQRRIGEWTSLAGRRGSIDDRSFCQQALAWQRAFTVELERAEASGCVSVSGTNSPRTMLAQVRAATASASCSTAD